jgi:hypothetical protein
MRKHHHHRVCNDLLVEPCAVEVHRVVIDCASTSTSIVQVLALVLHQDLQPLQC